LKNYPRRTFIRNSLLSAAGLTLSKYSFINTDTDYTFLSIAEVSELVRQRQVSPVELTKACLKKIEQINPKLNAFITVTSESAIREAEIAEAEIINGKWKGPLHGIPIALKDNIDTAGIRTTAASGVYKDRIPTEDAEIVTRLKSAGAIFLGKQNLHEFALGTTSVVSYFGSVHNPWNIDYIAGGSSGGSAAAVAAGLCFASIGTDTGGSSRLPPACCGITGFKATYGLISTRGIIPVIQSVDHACPICRTVEDAAILLNIIADQAQEGNNKIVDYRKSFDKIKNPRIGIVKNYKASEEVETVFKNTVRCFNSLGYKTISVDFPVMPIDSAISATEIEAYHRPLINKFHDQYDSITLNDINNENQATADEYINEKNKMEEDRDTISATLFKDCDALILPTTATVALTITNANEIGPFALDPYNTEPFNYFGLPAISVPCGFSKNSLPIGLQIVGPRWGESIVLDIADKYQKANNWHLRHPTII
jgi:aspartyl-tRNA(Asn)/glutamyl-tRNA(Gln) amidotransferase subunit A